MMRERPRLDRKRVLLEEARKRTTDRLLTNIVGELGRGEYLGAPIRIADKVVIPILRKDSIEVLEPDDNLVVEELFLR